MVGSYLPIEGNVMDWETVTNNVHHVRRLVESANAQIEIQLDHWVSLLMPILWNIFMTVNTDDPIHDMVAARKFWLTAVHVGHGRKGHQRKGPDGENLPDFLSGWITSLCFPSHRENDIQNHADQSLLLGLNPYVVNCPFIPIVNIPSAMTTVPIVIIM